MRGGQEVSGGEVYSSAMVVCCLRLSFFVGFCWLLLAVLFCRAISRHFHLTRLGECYDIIDMMENSCISSGILMMMMDGDGGYGIERREMERVFYPALTLSSWLHLIMRCTYVV